MTCVWGSLWGRLAVGIGRIKYFPFSSHKIDTSELSFRQERNSIPPWPPIPLPSFCCSGLANCPTKPETGLGFLSAPGYLGSFLIIGSHVDCSDASTRVARLRVAKTPERSSRIAHVFGSSFSTENHHAFFTSKFCTCALHILPFLCASLPPHC